MQLATTVLAASILWMTTDSSLVAAPTAPRAANPSPTSMFASAAPTTSAAVGKTHRGKARRWFAGMRDVVQFSASDDVVLKADFYVPRSKKSLAPGVVVVHRAGGNRAELESIATRLQKQGFGVLAVDLRGHGDSATKDFDWQNGDEQARMKLWSFSMRDLDAAANFLTQQEGMHGTNLSLVAYGNGGTLAARHAVRDENVRALAMVEPGQPYHGFNFTKDLADLGGLPTLMAVSKSGRSEVARLAEQVEQEDGGKGWIDIVVSKSESEQILGDKRLPAEIAKWLEDKASPSKGKGGR